jgi:hypothetical protein
MAAKDLGTISDGPRVGRQLFAGVFALVFAASLLAVWWGIARPQATSTARQESPPELPEPQVIPPGLTKAEFYRRDLVPLLDKTRERDLESVARALERLHLEFDRFRAGIPAFVEDVASISTRFGLVKRLARDKWINYRRGEDDPVSEEVKQYMLSKFQTHIMSEDAMQKAVGSALAQFKDDVTADRNQLLLEAKVALSTRDVHFDFPKPAYAAFEKAFDESVTRSVQKQATSSLVNGMVALVGSTVAGMAGEQVVAYVIDLVGTEAVAAGVEAAAAGGSSMATGGAVGGTSGWLGGPMGAAIGVGAGLAVGAVVDWWLTERFKVNLTEELSAYLNNLERDMIENQPATETQGARIGLRAMLQKAVEKLHDVQGTAVRNALAEAT